jgi:HAD superfamily hydrolase (TIGR01509 family)
MPKYQAWSEVYDQYDQKLTLVEYSKCIGSSNSAFDPLENLLKIQPGIINTDQIKQIQQARELELLSKERILPGVQELIECAKQQGLLLGIASSSDRPWVIAHLNRLHLLNYFDSVLTENDVDMVKPHPELYTKTLDTLSIPPNQTIAFEDSPNGILAAKKAGLFVIGVPNPITLQLDLSLANKIFSTLKNVSINELNQLLERNQLGHG